MATIQERTWRDSSTTYRVQIRLKGYPTQTATFKRKTDAKKWAQETETAIRQGKYFANSEAKRHTLADAIDRYVKSVLPTKSASSEYGQGLQLRWWKTQIGSYLLADVTPALIAEKRDQLASEFTYRKTLRSPASTSRYLAALSHCLSIAVKEWGWMDDNPCRKVTKPKEPRGRVRFLERDERERLLKACGESRNKYLYPITVLALSTGMRKNEIRYLRWNNLNFARNVVTVENSKNGERRAVPLVGHARELLQDLARVRQIDTDLVFPAPHRVGLVPKPIDIQSAWDRAVERAEIKDFRFHDLRHCAASYLLESGATLGQLAEILGHRTLQMVRRYSHLSHSASTEIVERMNAAVFDQIERPGATEGGNNVAR